MKKFILFATIAVLFFMSVGKADAQESRVINPMVNSDTCDTRWRSSHWNDPPTYVINSMSAHLKFRHCGNFDVFKQVTYQIDSNNPAPVNCIGIDSFHVNWGAYGTWNPPNRKWNCSSIDDKVYQKIVYPANSEENIGHSNNDRCARVYYKIDRNFDVDDHATSSLKCLD